MSRFIVQQRRPMWVLLGMEIEADTEGEAVDTFFDSFDPTMVILEGQAQSAECCPVSVHDASGRTKNDFPVSDWQYEVANGDTQLGYAEWLAKKAEIDL